MRFTLLILLTITITTANAQLISISDARLLPDGSTVTVNGIVTSGAEFGTIRYIQDGTAGVAVFSSSLAATVRGDNVTVTGVLSQYQNLLEITPVNSWLLNSSGNPLPAPLTVTPLQMNESNEAMLLQINNVTFTNGGSQFLGNSSYNFIANGENGVVYIKAGNPLVGTLIPTSNITLYGICSQFGNQYQMLPRDANDLVTSSSISITVSPFPLNINTSSFDVQWNTNINGNTFVKYGLTQNLELGVINGPANTSNPTITIPGGNPSQLFYVQVFSVAGIDTAYSNVKSFITASTSTGTIKTYFNRPVDHSVSIAPSNNAVYLPNLFDDTLKAYIDRALVTLDIEMYSFDNFGTALIIQAVNDAYNRGVRVRIITEGGNANAGLQSLDPNIPVVLSPVNPPAYYGIMHNKFFIIDAEDTDASKPVVMTGSTNWSNDQLYNDRNNLVLVQDQSLAKVYQMEFEEMWGGSGPLPVPANAKFGPDKTDNTPHEVNVAGTRVECFFSPSDNTNNQILRVINSADGELYFATLVFTRFDLAYGIEARVAVNNVMAAGIMDDSSGGSGTSFLIMQGVMGNNLLLFDHASQPGILHHKYLIVDQSVISSDPAVLTGSHNWSSAANLRNDENILIIHRQEVANQFYQEFHNLFNSNGGTLSLMETPDNQNLYLFPNPSAGRFTVRFDAVVPGYHEYNFTDLTGRILSSGKILAVKGINSIQLEEKIPSGCYFFTIHSETSNAVKKVVIE
jgi:phosphatidylserine/phosphatidylglycerophosphate/cardiolipin synthase-like enzyme/DNA/RNA endonuclease YhcR with UshA esterase domain